MTVEAMLHGTIHHRDFTVQQSIATLFQNCFKLLQHYSNIAALKLVFDTTMYFFLTYLKVTPLSRAAEMKPGAIQ